MIQGNKGNIKLSYREPHSCVYDTYNQLHEQPRSFGVEDARNTNCSGYTQIKHNADHTCCAALGQIKDNEFKRIDRADVKRKELQQKQKKHDPILVYTSDEINRKFFRLKGEDTRCTRCAEDERNLRRSQDERKKSRQKNHVERRREYPVRSDRYLGCNWDEHRINEDTERDRDRRRRQNNADGSEDEHTDYQDRLNTAVMESRIHSRNDRSEYDFHNSRNIRTPHSNVSGNLLEQQMQLMNEMLWMMSEQHEQLRGRTNNRQTLKVEPEKFSGSVGTSCYSFIAQFENCSEINQWNEREKSSCYAVL